VACRTVTPQSASPVAIAQSSDEGPRSPLMPGWTIRQVCRAQMLCGIATLSMGAMMSFSGCSSTALCMAFVTRGQWRPQRHDLFSVSSIRRRWLRLLCAGRDEQDPHRVDTVNAPATRDHRNDRPASACVVLRTFGFMCLPPNCRGDGRCEQARCALHEANRHSHRDLTWRYLVLRGCVEYSTA